MNNSVDIVSTINLTYKKMDKKNLGNALHIGVEAELVEYVKNWGCTVVDTMVCFPEPVQQQSTKSNLPSELITKERMDIFYVFK